MQRTRIVSDPAIVHGTPCVAGTRVPVVTIVDSLAAGMTVEEFLEAYPYIALEDVRAALTFAARRVDYRELPLLESA